ncbi:hypothetical protein L596_011204 [Steinernema carpocapsae]|uniref:Uncharacterized protein n=1 Tax=Steinernema carpocapsae TaxID=34508 RepID=A0A4U5NT29_STECR|nr:hypothetical protein L596_011204 [Steinernema carpocapsae]
MTEAVSATADSVAHKLISPLNSVVSSKWRLTDSAAASLDTFKDAASLSSVLSPEEVSASQTCVDTHRDSFLATISASSTPMPYNLSSMAFPISRLL